MPARKLRVTSHVDVWCIHCVVTQDGRIAGVRLVGSLVVARRRTAHVHGQVGR